MPAGRPDLPDDQILKGAIADYIERGVPTVRDLTAAVRHRLDPNVASARSLPRLMLPAFRFGLIGRLSLAVLVVLVAGGIVILAALPFQRARLNAALNAFVETPPTPSAAPLVPTPTQTPVFASTAQPVEQPPDQLQAIPFGPGVAYGAAWSPDGATLAVAASRSVDFYAVAGITASALSLKNVWPEDAAGMTHLTFSADGALLSGQQPGPDGAWISWSNPGGAQRQLVPNSGPRALSPDGQLVATLNTEALSGLQSLSVVDARTGQSRLSTIASAPRGLAYGSACVGDRSGMVFSPDRRWLACAGPAGVELWDAGSGARVRVLSLSGLSPESTAPPAIGFSANSARVFAVTATAARVWTVTSEEPLVSYGAAMGMYAATIDADGSLLAVYERRADGLLGKSTRVVVIQLQTLQEQGSVTLPSPLGPSHLAFSPDQKRLAIVSGDAVRVCDLQSQSNAGREWQCALAPPYAGAVADIATGGGRQASGMAVAENGLAGGILTLNSLDSGRMVWRQALSGTLSQVAVSPDGAHIATVVHSPDTGSEVRLFDSAGYAGPVFPDAEGPIAFSSDGARLYFHRSRALAEVTIVTSQTGSIALPAGLAASPNLRLSPQADYVAGEIGKTLSIAAIADGRVMVSSTAPSVADWQVRFAHASPRVLIHTSAGGARVWDYTTGQSVSGAELALSTSMPGLAALSPDGKLAAFAARDDAAIQVFVVDTGLPMQPGVDGPGRNKPAWTVWGSRVAGLVFESDTRLASVTADGLVQLWKVDALRPAPNLAELLKPIAPASGRVSGATMQITVGFGLAGPQIDWGRAKGLNQDLLAVPASDGIHLFESVRGALEPRRVISTGFAVDGVSFSSDQAALIGHGPRDEWGVWPVDGSRERTQFVGTPDTAISPDLKWVTVTDGRDVLIMNLATGAVRTRLVDASVTTLRAAGVVPSFWRFSPGGKFAIRSIGTVGVLDLWNVDTGKPFGRAAAGPDQFFTWGGPEVMFSRDDKHAARSAGGIVQLWDMANHTIVYSASVGSSAAQVFLSPSGEWMATVEPLDGRLTLRHTSAPDRAVTTVSELTLRTPGQLRFSPDERQIVWIDSEGPRLIWSADIPLAPQPDLEFAGPTTLAWSPDGGRLAVGTSGGLVKTFEVQSGLALGVKRLGGLATLLTYGPGGQLLAARYAITSGAALPSVWLDLSNGSSGPSAAVTLSQMIATGNTMPPVVTQDSLVFAYPDRDQPGGEAQVLRYQVAAGKVVSTPLGGNPLDQRRLVTQLSADGELVAAILMPNPSIGIWNARTGEFIHIITDTRIGDLIDSGTRAWLGLSFAADNKIVLLASSQSRYVGAWDIASSRRIFTTTVAATDLAVAPKFSADGRYYGVSLPPADARYGPGRVMVFDVFEDRQLADFEVARSAVVDFGFSPDGRSVAIASADGVISIASLLAYAPPLPGLSSLAKPITRRPGLEPGEALRITVNEGMPGEPAWAHNAVLNKDVLAVPASFGITLYDVGASSAVTIAVYPSEFAVRQVGFSPDGAQIYGFGQHGERGVWPVRTGRVEAITQTVGSPDAAYSPNGQWVAAPLGSAMLIYDARSGALVGRAAEKMENPSSTSPPTRWYFGASSQRLYHSRAGGAQTIVWAVDSLTVKSSTLANRYLAAFDGTGPAQFVVESADGSRILGLRYGSSSLPIWDGALGARVFTASLAGAINIALSSDGRWLAGIENFGVNGPGGIYVWSADPGLSQTAAISMPNNGYNSLAFSPDGRRLLGVNSFGIDLLSYSYSKLTFTPARLTQTRIPNALAFSADRALIGLSEYPTGLRLWDAATGAPRLTISDTGDVIAAIQFSPDHTRALLSRFGKPGAFISTTLINTSDEHELVGGLPGDVRFSADGAELVYLAPWDSNRPALILSRFDIAQGRVITFPVAATDPGPLQPVTALNADGSILVHTSGGHAVDVTDARTGRLIRTLSTQALLARNPESPPLLVANGSLVIVTIAGGGSQLLDLQSGLPVDYPALTGKVEYRDAVFSPDGRYIAAQVQPGPLIVVYSAATGELVASIDSHRQWVSSILFTSDSRSLLTASADGTLRVWDIATLVAKPS